MPVTVEDVEKIEVQGITIGVVVIPIAASGVQFVLTDQINEIMSVGFVDFEGNFNWPYGEPLRFKEDIEEELLKLFKCGKYWEG